MEKDKIVCFWRGGWRKAYILDKKIKNGTIGPDGNKYDLYISKCGKYVSSYTYHFRDTIHVGTVEQALNEGKEF